MTDNPSPYSSIDPEAPDPRAKKLTNKAACEADAAPGITKEAYRDRRLECSFADFDNDPIAQTGMILMRAGGNWSTDAGIPPEAPILILAPNEFDPDTDDFVNICTIIPFPANRQGFGAAYRLGRLLNRRRGDGWIEGFASELHPDDRWVANEIIAGNDHPLPIREAV